jgi:hypothetical protein
MAVTIGALTLDRLVVLPVAWDEVDVRNGVVAREWEFDGILKPADCAAVQSLFTAWVAARRTEAGPATGNVGTTVAFTGAAAGQSWTAVPCWFSAAPVTPRIGAKFRCSFRLIDAAQAVAAELASQERERDGEQTYGTFTLSGVVLTLLEQPEGFADVPSVERTAAGTDMIKGPLGARDTMAIRGATTDAGAWAAIKSWYRARVAGTGTPGTWYPVSAPQMKEERISVNGVLTTRYLIDLDLRRLGT